MFAATLEDRRSRSHFMILSRCQPDAYRSCNTTSQALTSMERMSLRWSTSTWFTDLWFARRRHIRGGFRV